MVPVGRRQAFMYLYTNYEAGKFKVPFIMTDSRVALLMQDVLCLDNPFLEWRLSTSCTQNTAVCIHTSVIQYTVEWVTFLRNALLHSIIVWHRHHMGVVKKHNLHAKFWYVPLLKKKVTWKLLTEHTKWLLCITGLECETCIDGHLIQLNKIDS